MRKAGNSRLSFFDKWIYDLIGMYVNARHVIT